MAFAVSKADTMNPHAHTYMVDARCYSPTAQPRSDELNTLKCAPTSTCGISGTGARNIDPTRHPLEPDKGGRLQKSRGQWNPPRPEHVRTYLVHCTHHSRYWSSPVLLFYSVRCITYVERITSQAPVCSLWIQFRGFPLTFVQSQGVQVVSFASYTCTPFETHLYSYLLTYIEEEAGMQIYKWHVCKAMG